MKPSIGRIVHYYPQESDRFGVMGKPISAIVVAVHSAECVNLRLFPDCHDSPWVSSVSRDENNVEFSWSWPPRE